MSNITTTDNWTSLFIEELKTVNNASALLKKVREYKEQISLKNIDFFLYSEDLGAFFFPETDEKNSYRNTFKNITGKIHDLSPTPDKLEELETRLKQEINSHISLRAIKFNNKFFGFMLIETEPEIKNHNIRNLALLLCDSLISSFSKNQLIEKLHLEKKVLENNMVQNENLKLLGESIAGLTHDLNNVFTGVTGFSQLIEMFEEDPEILDSVSEISKVSHQGKELVNYISKTKKISPAENESSVDINQVIQETTLHSKQIIEQLYPGTSVESHFELELGATTNVATQPGLINQLFSHIFTRFIKSEKDIIKVTTSQEREKTLVTIDAGSSGHAPVKLTDTQTEPDFPGSLLFYLLSEQLNFDFKLNPSSINITFPADKVSPEILADLNILFYDADELITGLYKKILKQLEIEGKVCESDSEFKEELKTGKYNRVLLDLDLAVNLEEGLFSRNEKTVLTTGWGKFIKIEETMKTLSFQPDTFLAKPFTINFLIKTLA
ncbi:MAG: hypothetical protein ACLFQV_04125 [Vulcanimicrobiota bacterium]